MRTPAFWQHRHLASTALLPISTLYGLGAALDRNLTKPRQAPLPILSIGNVTAGGAGKTPTALALAPMLRSMGHTPHFITRGYGSTGDTRRAAPDGDWKLLGDEPLLLSAIAPTWVGADRLASATAAKAAGASLVIADDALQHHALKKDVSLLIIDGNYGFGNGRLLPAGPLREPVAQALRRSDAVLIIGGNRHQLTFDLPTFTGQLTPLGDAANLRGKKLYAFAGLARPQKFYDILHSLGAELVATRDFPDHHPFSAAELQHICDEAQQLGATPIATAKDAVKFPAPFRARIRVLEAALRFDAPDALQNWLQTRLPAPI